MRTLLLVMMMAASVARAQDLPANDEVLHVLVGRSRVLTSATPLKRIYVGNPAVLQTFTSGLKEIVLTPKTAGSSSLVGCGMWRAGGGSIRWRRTSIRRICRAR